MNGLCDAAGTVHERASAPVRIVSLVPSITELLFALGLGENVVGRTGFCIHPRETVRRIPKVGGTKDVRLDRVRALAPTHVIANVDENRKETVDALAAFVPHVVVTHPLDPEDNLTLYRLLGGIFGREAQAEALAARFAAALEETRRAAVAFAPERVLYLIWRDPWMTVSRDTYLSRTLALVNWLTVPEVAAARYPAVELSAATLARVDAVLLASEPYRFTAQHAAELASLPAFAGKRVARVDGEMTSWYGSRAIAGLGYLTALRQRWR
ncbi:MAG: helical backbone metal receptor [Burkholderiales bacterium]|nr:helical backbone metal receptor [Burkholderiales bacterium]